MSASILLAFLSPSTACLSLRTFFQPMLLLSGVSIRIPAMHATAAARRRHAADQQAFVMSADGVGVRRRLRVRVEAARRIARRPPHILHSNNYANEDIIHSLYHLVCDVIMTQKPSQKRFSWGERRRTNVPVVLPKVRKILP
jgi:hypothetical protein